MKAKISLVAKVLTTRDGLSMPAHSRETDTFLHTSICFYLISMKVAQ